MIPHVFHRVWVGSNPVPEEFEHYGETWRRHHPNWELRQWTDVNLPADFPAAALDPERDPTERSDLLRYELLRRFGGVYIDMDFECLRPIDPLLDGVDFFVGYIAPERAGSAIIGATEGHPIMERAAREAAPLDPPGAYDKAATGPDFLNGLLARAHEPVTYIERDKLYPASADVPGAHAVHHEARAWRSHGELSGMVSELSRRLEKSEARVAKLERQKEKAERRREQQDVRIAELERPAVRLARTLASVPHALRSRAVGGGAAVARAPDAPVDGDPRFGRLDYDKRDVFLEQVADPKRLRACRKEPFTVRWLEEWLRSGDTLYDVGANVGVYALVAAAYHGGGVDVLAFEPGYATFASLCDNVRVNGLASSVVPLPLALSAQTGLASLAYSSIEAGEAMHRLSPGAPARAVGLSEREASRAAFVQPLVTFRMDDLVERLGLPRPDHVKLDVDGSEVAVLEGADATLASGAVRSMMVELEGTDEERIREILEGHGLRLVERYERTSAPGKPPPPRYGLFARD